MSRPEQQGTLNDLPAAEDLLDFRPYCATLRDL